MGSREVHLSAGKGNLRLVSFVKCRGGRLTWADWPAFLAVSYSPGALMG